MRSVLWQCLCIRALPLVSCLCSLGTLAIFTLSAYQPGFLSLHQMPVNLAIHGVPFALLPLRLPAPSCCCS